MRIRAPIIVVFSRCTACIDVILTSDSRPNNQKDVMHKRERERERERDVLGSRFR